MPHDNDFLAQYTPKDWVLIIAALMRKCGLEEVELTLDELNKVNENCDVVGMAHLPGVLVLKFISAEDAAKLRELGAVMYGSIEPKKLN